ncbi:hypothetical protein VMCG_07748 [Cytospora schulzeri]|uniref:Uncharacterized protein n=1 Tax=Cytospora schulzeri TaxID=448051 RepID=A0A423VZX3_9PEZI|nr:hypothetical protein VMCG_07748 [Valsa malicola]
MHRFKHRPNRNTPQSQESLSLSRVQSSSSPAVYLINATTGDTDKNVDVDHKNSSATGSEIMTSTCFDIPGHRIERGMGTVYGISVRSRGVLPVMGASLKTLAGGDIGAVTKLMYRTRDDAIARLTTECRKREANAVVGLRFDTSQVADGMAQVCAYGTAVYVVRVDGGSTRGGIDGIDLAPVAELADKNYQGVLLGTGMRNARSLDLA